MTIIKVGQYWAKDNETRKVLSRDESNPDILGWQVNSCHDFDCCDTSDTFFGSDNDMQQWVVGAILKVEGH